MVVRIGSLLIINKKGLRDEYKRYGERAEMSHDGEIVPKYVSVYACLELFTRFLVGEYD